MTSTFALPSFLVVVGGGIGAWLRYLVSRLTVVWLGADAGFPWATLACNVGGSLAMGILIAWLSRGGELGSLGGEGARLLLGVGVLGGFTTFSSFALEFAVMVERGTLGLAALYVGVSLVAGFVALFAGLTLVRSLA